MPSIHRRSFLDPRRMAETSGHILGALDEIQSLSSPAGPETEQTLIRYARPAMGTIFEIVLPFGHRVPTSLIQDALDLIDDLEERLTVYRDSSEVNELNRRASGEPVPISPELFDVLTLSQALSEQTCGAFDVTAGALIDTWGFVHGPKRVPSDLERQSALSRCGFQHLLLNAAGQKVRFSVEGMRVNLGSIGKGYALDRLAAYFSKHAPDQPVLLHGGKSSVIGVGTPPGTSSGWSVRLEHPWNPHVPLATVYLRDRAMATSAATYKHLVHEGKKLGHILDPRTGWPGQGMASASAIASSAAVADALATAFYLQGVEWNREYCRQHESIGAVVLEDGKSEPVILNSMSALATEPTR